MRLYVKGLVLSFLGLLVIFKAIGQTPCVEADFSFAKDSLCINENIEFANNSSNASYYYWDFCTGDILEAGEANEAFTFTGFGTISSIKLFSDDSLNYIALTSRSNNKFALIQLSDSLNENITSDKVSIFSSPFFDGPEGIYLYKEADKWFGLLTNFNSDQLIRISFGVSLSNPTPEITNVNLPVGITLSQASGLEIVENNNGEIVAFIANRAKNEIVRLEFENGLENDPIIGNTITIGGLSLPRTIRFIGQCDNWYALVLGLTGDKLFLLNFGPDLLAAPTNIKLTQTGSPLSIARDLSIVEEGGKYYCLAASSSSGSLFRVILGEPLESLDTVEVQNLGNYGVLGNSLGFDVKWFAGKYIGYGVDGKLQKVEFEATCPVNKLYSYEEIPNSISYTASGDFPINLKVFDAKGRSTSYLDTIHVSNNVAPDLNFSINDNQCSGNDNIFDGDAFNEPILSWQWSFGDSNNSTGQQVTHQYSTSGTYPVILEVEASNGCGQRVTKPITIYDPPAPSYSIPPGIVCSGGSVEFTNQTNTQGADSLISYSWDFDGMGSASSTDTSFVFEDGGDKTVTLTASIPGCSTNYDSTFNILQGPEVNYAFADICQGSEVQLENLTTGTGITDYAWTFGDGGTFSSTTKVSPFHIYDTPGDFPITLTVNDAQGCANTLEKSIAVFAKPQSGFLSELSCPGTTTRFTDSSTIDPSANIILWNWDFGDGSATDNAKNPEHIFNDSGTFPVKLTTQSSGGCIDTLVQELTVETTATPDFSTALLCADTAYPVQLSDQSVPVSGEEVIQWFWEVEDTVYTVKNPVHVFSDTGTYDIGLTIVASSLCTARLQKQVQVTPESVPGFTFNQGCVGEPVQFTNQSTYPEGITAYQWNFGGLATNTEASPFFTFPESGDYAVSLVITTTQGCTDTLTQMVQVAPMPTASFSVNKTTGAAPFTVEFTNQSTEADTYSWTFDSLGQSDEENPAFTFTDAGEYEVTLIATNAAGCIDSTIQKITVVAPVLSTALDNISLKALGSSLPGNTNHEIILTLHNLGTVTVQHWMVELVLDDALTVQEEFEQVVEPGETLNYPLSFSFFGKENTPDKIRYLCATLQSKEENFSEIDLSNNKFCINIDHDFFSIPPYPNPVRGELTIPVVLQEKDVVNVAVENVMGSFLHHKSFIGVQKGLNTFTWDVSTFPSGMYIVQLTYQGKVKTYKILVNVTH